VAALSVMTRRGVVHRSGQEGCPTLPWDMDSAAVVWCCLPSFDASYKAWPSRVMTVAIRRVRT
jgi:hypothetical protein